VVAVVVAVAELPQFPVTKKALYYQSAEAALAETGTEGVADQVVHRLRATVILHQQPADTTAATVK
jgi:hypothetical protein